MTERFGRRCFLTRRSASIALWLLLVPTVGSAQDPDNLVGSTSGRLTTTPSGAVAYTMPIWAPPATAGIAPAIALRYNSQAAAGHVGEGWSITGLSAISRCPKTLDQDQEIRRVEFDNADRFCLDGQRLVATDGAYGADGTEYHTEIDSFARITSFNVGAQTPGRFRIELQNGTFIEYGASADSRIEVSGSPSGPVRTWALTRRCDRFGNCIAFDYTEDNNNGEYRPLYVKYVVNDSESLSARYRVTFDWESRPASDTWEAFRGGYRTTLSQRLWRVRTEYNNGSGWSTVRQFEVGHSTAPSGRSQVDWIQEGTLNGGRLPEVRFEWERGTASASRYKAGDSSDVIESTRIGDFDNDGHQDIYIASSPSGSWTVLRENSAGNGIDRVMSSVSAPEPALLCVRHIPG